MKEEMNWTMKAHLLFDGFKAHLMDDIVEELNRNNIHIVCLPPHSSHILQILNVAVFGPMKTYYRNFKTQLFNEDSLKIAKKIEKIIKVFYHASYIGNIYAGREECRIKLHFENGNVQNVSINRVKVLAKLGN